MLSNVKLKNYPIHSAELLNTDTLTISRGRPKHTAPSLIGPYQGSKQRRQRPLSLAPLETWKTSTPQNSKMFWRLMVIYLYIFTSIIKQRALQQRLRLKDDITESHAGKRLQRSCSVSDLSIYRKTVGRDGVSSDDEENLTQMFWLDEDLLEKNQDQSFLICEHSTTVTPVPADTAKMEGKKGQRSMYRLWIMCLKKKWNVTGSHYIWRAVLPVS